MSKKKTKARRLSAQRKLFLEAVKLLQPYFGEYGTLSDRHCADDVSCRLEELCENLPRGGKGLHVPEVAEAICSALYFMHSSQDIDGIEDVSEACAGGEVFEVAFNLGWAMGFDCGKDDGPEKEPAP